MNATLKQLALWKNKLSSFEKENFKDGGLDGIYKLLKLRRET